MVSFPGPVHLEMIRGPRDRQRAAMVREVAAGTQESDISGIVAAAIGAVDQV